jgi:hypothetical protein
LLAEGPALFAGACAVAGFAAVLVTASAAYAGPTQSAAETASNEAMAERHARGRGFDMVFPLILGTGLQLEGR